MKTVEISRNLTITLPKGVFKPSERVVILTEGSMVIIKRLDATRLSSVAGRVKGRALPLSAIAREVHAYRRAKRAR